MLEANLKNSMCYRTWNDMIISLTKKSVSWCCKTKHTPEQDIQTTFDLETLEKQGLNFFINHPVLNKRKHELSSGIRSNDCRRCWETEDSSGSSARTQYIENVHPVWKNRLQNAIDNPKTAISFHNSMKEYDGTKFIEIELTNKCNMACVYCWEGLSSRWQKELKRPMPDTDDKIFDKVLEILNEYWDTKLKNEPSVCFSLIRGETFFTNHLFKFLEKLIVRIDKEKHKKAKVVVNITTSLNFTEKRFEQFSDIVSKTPNIIYDMQISNEAVGKKAELIRWGLNFDKFDVSLDKFIELAKTKDNIILGFGVAHNCLSLPYTKEYFEYIDNKLVKSKYKKPIHMHTNWVDSPIHMGVSMVDKKHVKAFTDAIDYINFNFSTEIIKKDVYINALNTISDIVNTDVSDTKKNDARIKFQELEKRRKISFAEHFPHYNELIG